jgi:hypothetical protein
MYKTTFLCAGALFLLLAGIPSGAAAPQDEGVFYLENLGGRPGENRFLDGAGDTAAVYVSPHARGGVPAGSCGARATPG